MFCKDTVVGHRSHVQSTFFFQPPQSPQYIAATFSFYSLANPSQLQVVDYYNNLGGSIAALQGDMSRPLTMIVHGFVPSGSDSETWS